jgi:hypothetical protein
MKKILPIFLSSLCLLTFNSLPSYAEEHKHKKQHEHDDEHKHEEHHKHTHDNNDNEHTEMEQHGAHEHGVAKLMIAVTDSGLELMLDTPAANIFGFEHQPETDGQKKQVALSKAKLADATTLFVPSKAANCTAEDSTIHSPLLEKPNKKDSHSDVEANWVFKCQHTEKLENIDVQLFSAFPEGFEHLQVEWIATKGASATELTEDGSIALK